MKKILIVDDSLGWLKYHKEALEKIYGDKYLLETASSAREGYNTVYNNINDPYALIISDLQMEMAYEPLHAGEWFIEQIQKLIQYKNTPIIIISAAYNIRSIANKLGVDYLPKSTAASDISSYKDAMDLLSL